MEISKLLLISLSAIRSKFLLLFFDATGAEYSAPASCQLILELLQTFWGV